MDLYKKSILIVTPDLLGPVTNGGIGTYVFELSKILANEYNVHIVSSTVKGNGSWRNAYESLGIKVVTIDEIKIDSPTLLGVDHDDQNSYRIFNYVRSLNIKFEMIILQDWKAVGFHIVRAKRVGLDFDNTRIVTVFHSPTLWSELAGNSFNAFWRKDEYGALMNARLNFREKYQIANSDDVFFPSTYMKDWATENNFTLPEGITVVTNPYTPSFKDRVEDFYPEGLAFFGRLEFRKGLDLFLDAIEICHNKGMNFGKLVLLGKYGTVNGENSESYIQKFSNRTGLNLEVHTNFDSKKALSFLRDNNLIAVHPSRRDNLPYSVVESLAEQVPILVSNVGGTAEIVSPTMKFELDSKKLANCIEDNFRKPWSELIANYPWKDINKSYLNAIKVAIETPKITKEINENPLVSILIPYFNTGEFIEETLMSIENQSYQNVEILIANCNSTEESSTNKFQELRLRYLNQDKFNFINFDTCPVQIAKNQLAQLAKGEYVVFLDSDNVLLDTNSLDILVNAAITSNLDFITTGHIGFSTRSAPNKISKFDQIWMPLGQVDFLGWYENVYGDTFGICKRSSFLSGGGYIEDVDFYEDWALYMNISRLGYSLDVIPLPLMWYRHRINSRRMLTKEFETQLKLFGLFEKAFSPKFSGFFESTLAAFVFQDSNGVRSSAREILSAIEGIANRFLPRGSIRRKVLIRLIFWLAKL